MRPKLCHNQGPKLCEQPAICRWPLARLWANKGPIGQRLVLYQQLGSSLSRPSTVLWPMGRQRRYEQVCCRLTPYNTNSQTLCRLFCLLRQTKWGRFEAFAQTRCCAEKPCCSCYPIVRQPRLVRQRSYRVVLPCWEEAFHPLIGLCHRCGFRRYSPCNEAATSRWVATRRYSLR